MRTRFEIVLLGRDQSRLVAAGEEALAEIEECDARLSVFRAGSLLSLINREAAGRAVGVDQETFALVRAAQRLHAQTEGAFDPTVGPLMKAWRLHGDERSAVAAESVQSARACVGMHLVELDEQARTVRFAREGVSLDLGGLAKGHALELAERVLRRVGIGAGGESAMIHAGTSSVTAVGAPPGEPGWRVAIRPPRPPRPPLLPRAGHPGSNAGTGSGEGTGEDTAAHVRVGPGSINDGPEWSGPYPVVVLRDRSLSVSGVWGRVVESAQGVVHHIMDPRTGSSARGALLAGAVSPTGVEAEGVSTALVVLNRTPRGPMGWRDLVTIRHVAGREPAWEIEGAGADGVVYLCSSGGAGGRE